MKSPEVAFLQIMQSIQENFNEGTARIDNNDHIYTNVIHCSRYLENKTRYLCRKTEGTINYVFEGTIDISNNLNMRYYFSNKRSYISLDTNHAFEENAAFMQLNTFKYTELLYKFYNIDEFVFNFVNK